MPAVLVTVLMTVYNGERYLRQAVESVLEQQYSNFEFIIVDDASTDGSLDILKSYQDPRIRIIVNPVNSGQTVSLNIGLRAARGEYIARIDADDVALPRWLKYQKKMADENPSSVVVSSWAGVINENGYVRQLLKIPLTHEEMVLRSLTASPINHGGCLMKREVMLRYGGYDESFRILADYDLWTRLLQGGEHFSAGKIIGMAIRFHEGSVSKAEKNSLVVEEAKRIFQRHITFLTGMKLSDEDLTRWWQVCYRSDIMSVQDLEKAIISLKSVYSCICLKDSSSFNIMAHSRERLNVFLVKKIFACSLSGDSIGVRSGCSLLSECCGFSMAAVVFRFNSFLGFAGKILPVLFHMKQRLIAIVILQRVRL